MTSCVAGKLTGACGCGDSNPCETNAVPSDEAGAAEEGDAIMDEAEAAADAVPTADDN